MRPRSALLVEDNEDDRFLATRVLRKAGIADIRFACDGKEALDQLFSSANPLPEVMILDLRLPLIDGLKVFTDIRGQEKTLSLPVLVLTSSDDPYDRETCLKLGAIAFLTKPLTLEIIQQLFD